MLGLFLPCLLAAILAWIGFRAERELAQSARLISHTLEVQRQLQALRGFILQAESAQRAYLLTNREIYLETYKASVERLPKEVASLRRLTADNRLQQSNLAALDPDLTAKLAFMEETIASEGRGDAAGALTLVNTDRGKGAMEAILTRLDKMEKEETRLLAAREEHLVARSQFSSAFLVGLVALNLLFAATMLALFHRLSRIQGLVTVCAWSRTVEYEGAWVSFEEYLRRRFHLDTSHGISPAEAEKALRTASPRGAQTRAS